MLFNILFIVVIAISFCLSIVCLFLAEIAYRYEMLREKCFIIALKLTIVAFAFSIIAGVICLFNFNLAKLELVIFAGGMALVIKGIIIEFKSKFEK